MSDQDTKPAEAVSAPAKDTEAVVIEPESETTKTDAPTKPEATSEVSDVKPDEKEPAEEADVKPDEKEPAKEADDDKPKNVRPSIYNPPEGMLRTGGKRRAANEDDHKKNIKFDPSTLPDTDDPNLIRTQVEFYFGDSNLPMDTHLMGKVGGEQNNPVPLSDICSFKRMRRFKPYSAVVAALKESKSLVVEGEEGQETIRRKHPWDPSKRQKIDERSIYAKGFGDEEPSTQFDIEAFFSQFGVFNSVRLRRSDNKLFKGSVFVEWADKETAEKFLALDPEPKWKDHPLLIMSKLEYQSQKAKEIREGDREPNASKRFKDGFHRGGRGGRGRGNFRGDSNDWKKRRDHDQKNGFGDRRGGRGGRGDRGRGRGRGSHGGRGRDRGENGRAIKEEPVDDREVGPPKIHTSSEGAKIMKEEMNGSGGKRAREDDGGADEHQAKKVDQKEVAAEAA